MTDIYSYLKEIFLKENDSFEDILGQDSIKLQLKSALISKRHIIIVGAPGIGKTTLAKNLAKLLPDAIVNDCGFNCNPKEPMCPICKAGKPKTKKIGASQRFVRIQGSPDLTAEDLIGDIDPIKALKFGPLSIEAFSPGKIFKANNGVLFFDEVNRCPEKLQNALLQVLEEGKATIGSYAVDLPANFIFIGTMNPQDSSTEKLSDVFMDRFDIIYMTYPESEEVEEKIVSKNSSEIEAEFPNKLYTLAVSFVRLLRQDKNLEKKPSVRASIGLVERAKANCYLRKGKQVSLDDIKDAVISVLSHRIKLKPSFKYIKSPKEYISEEFTNFCKRSSGISDGEAP